MHAIPLRLSIIHRIFQTTKYFNCACGRYVFYFYTEFLLIYKECDQSTLFFIGEQDLPISKDSQVYQYYGFWCWYNALYFTSASSCFCFDTTCQLHIHPCNTAFANQNTGWLNKNTNQRINHHLTDYLTYRIDLHNITQTLIKYFVFLKNKTTWVISTWICVMLGFLVSQDFKQVDIWIFLDKWNSV